MKIFSLGFFFCLIYGFSFAQESKNVMPKGKNDTIQVFATRDIDGSLMPWIPLTDVPIKGKRTFSDPEARFHYDRLRRNVLMLLPYARFARDRYAKLNNDLSKTENNRQERQLVKACDKEIKDMFNKKIKDMSPTQGVILVKLINRETGKSTYDLVKELKGGITAFVYQSMARVSGNNLKYQYDRQEDSDIEAIIQSSGYYSEPAKYN
ncbi:MAG: DUF4294 domain-containing protein [Pyrinomonadaceae bacterium]|nr:DUF4294 domain-containing protein [Sphingobacteriaceae bacterium]